MCYFLSIVALLVGCAACQPALSDTQPQDHSRVDDSYYYYYYYYYYYLTIRIY